MPRFRLVSCFLPPCQCESAELINGVQCLPRVKITYVVSLRNKLLTPLGKQCSNQHRSLETISTLYIYKKRIKKIMKKILSIFMSWRCDFCNFLSEGKITLVEMVE